MGKEFGGGAIPAGMAGVPVSWEEDRPVPIAITQFDFASLDGLEDEIAERLDAGQDIADLLAGLRRAAYLEGAGNGINIALSHVISAKAPRRKAYELAFAGGLALTMGWSGPRIAELFRVRKQAFFQGVKAARVELGITHLATANRRDPASRERMRRRNFRRNKHAVNLDPSKDSKHD